MTALVLVLAVLALIVGAAWVVANLLVHDLVDDAALAVSLDLAETDNHDDALTRLFATRRYPAPDPFATTRHEIRALPTTQEHS